MVAVKHSIFLKENSVNFVNETVSKSVRNAMEIKDKESSCPHLFASQFVENE